MNTTTKSDIIRAPDHLRGLLRHFSDLRDVTHGDGAVNRSDKAIRTAYLKAPGPLA